MEILKFYTPTCMPCKVLGKLLDKMGLQVTEIDATEDLDAVNKYNVSSTPTLIFLKDGVEVNRTTGLVNESKIKEIIGNE